MIPINKETLGYISVAGSFAITIPYCLLVLKGSAKPHVFTWVIWALVMGIAAAARSAENAGPGAWASWMTSAMCATVALFALFKGERAIKRSDVIAFVAALLAIPVWRATHDPLAAIVMVTIIDVIGYYPTLRKSWVRPDQEPVFNYTVGSCVSLLSICATEHYNLATLLYPVVLITANMTLVALILYWRRILTV